MPIPIRRPGSRRRRSNWRRDIHQNPELLYDVHLTAKYVADRLTAFGCDEVKTSIGRTGVVGVIRGEKGSSTRAIGLRADMDALPIEEATNLPIAPVSRAKCTPAVTTAIRRCCSARRGAWPRRATSPAMPSSSSSPPKRAARAQWR